MVDLRVYLVTDPAHEDLERVVAEAVAGGVTCVQVRDKSATSADRTALTASLRALLPRDTLVLANDDLDAARAGDGLHVGVDDVSPSAARAALGATAVIGWSINDLDQLDDHTQLAACDYLAVSPVWDTATKPDTSLAWGVDGIREVRRRAGRVPIVAIGGIDAGNAAEVVEAGADGIAVVSAICGADDPRAAAHALRDIVDRSLEQEGPRP